MCWRDFLSIGTDWISCMHVAQYPRLPFCVQFYIQRIILWSRYVRCHARRLSSANKVGMLKSSFLYRLPYILLCTKHVLLQCCTNALLYWATVSSPNPLQKSASSPSTLPNRSNRRKNIVKEQHTNVVLTCNLRYF